MAKYILRISLSCLLLVFIGSKIDWPVISATFRHIRLEWFLLSLIIFLSGVWVRAGKYYFLMRDTSLHSTINRLAAINFISQFYALFIPTALGSEAVRWYKITKGKQGKSLFLSVTAYERILFMLTLICFGMIPLLFKQQPAEVVSLRYRLIPVAVGFSLVLSLGLFYLLSRKLHAAAKTFLKNRLRLRKGGRVDLLLDNLDLKDKSMRLLVLLVLLTLCWQISYIVQIYSLFNAIGVFLGITEAAWMGSLVLLLQVLPVSFIGLGLREGAYAYLFTLYGLPAEQGVAIGLLFFTQMMVVAGIGAVVDLFEK